MISLTYSEKIKALQIRACDRGFALLDEVGQFLLYHYPRDDMSALFHLLDELDRASLVAPEQINHTICNISSRGTINLY